MRFWVKYPGSHDIHTVLIKEMMLTESSDILKIKKIAIQRLQSCWSELSGIFLLKAGYGLFFLIIWILFACFLDIAVISGVSAAGIRIISPVRFMVLGGIVLLAAYFIKIPFNYGARWYMIQIARGSNPGLKSLFSCYVSRRMFSGAIKTELAVLLRKLAYVLPLTATGASLMILWDGFLKNIGNTFWNAVLWVITSFIIFLLAGIYIAVTFKYRLVRYYYAQNPGGAAREYIKRSKETISSRENFLFDLIISMVKWIVPCVLIFPVVFVSSYFSTVGSCAMNGMIEDFALREKTIEETKEAVLAH